jgi:hypothetical protein
MNFFYVTTSHIRGMLSGWDMPILRLAVIKVDSPSSLFAPKLSRISLLDFLEECTNGSIDQAFSEENSSLKTNLGYGNDAFNAIGITSAGSELFIKAHAGARITYTTISGARGWVSAAKILGTIKFIGNASLIGGVLVDATLSATGNQSWVKTGLNTTVGALPFLIGTGPGMVIGVIYLVADKTGMFDRPEYITPYTPPSIAMPDATRMAGRIMFP